MGLREEMDKLKERRYMHAVVPPIGEIAIRSLNEFERGHWQVENMSSFNGKSDDQLVSEQSKNIALSNARLVQLALCNPETHKRIYGDDPTEAYEIAEMDTGVIGKICLLIDEHCGFKPLSDEDIKGMIKNSGTTHGDTSPTLSLENVG